MSLDPMPDNATLRRMKEERDRGVFRTFGPIVRQPIVEISRGTAASVVLDVTISPITPVRLRIPWSALISDNAKYLIRQGKLYKTVAYREARKAIAALARDAMQGRPAAAFPLQLEARVYVPDNRIHDVHNFGKCCIDAMTKTVFVDDHWLHDVRWVRAGVCVDAPRAEITIKPIPSGT